MLAYCEFPYRRKAVEYLQFIEVLTPLPKLTIDLLVYPQQCLRYPTLVGKTDCVPFLDTKISNLLCANWKKNSAECALTRVIEKIRKTLDSKGVASMISMDLSNAFDCMPHDLLIAKLASRRNPHLRNNFCK